MGKYSKMFHDASPEIFSRAKSLRQNMTSSELNLCELIKVRYNKYKFRLQHPIGPYIADFYCHKLKLVIELDGRHHTDDKCQKIS
jgi:very-short-patch-repair endonuclease